jgi:hypothetical protein
VSWSSTASFSRFTATRCGCPTARAACASTSAIPAPWPSCRSSATVRCCSSGSSATRINEPHLETAKRELLEETGYTAAEWTRLGVIHTAIAYTDEAIEIFLARKLEKRRAAQLDAGEFVETLIVPFDEALAMVHDGRITDAKTVAALLWVRTWGGAHQSSGKPRSTKLR